MEASIMARLLRWRVLTLDASVMVLPANPPPTDTGLVTMRRDSRRRGAATRRRLAEATKNIDHAEQELARARHTNNVAAPQPRRTPAPLRP